MDDPNLTANAVLDTRVGNLESGLAGVKKDVADLNHGMVNMGQALTKEIKDLGTTFVAARATNWPAVITMCVAIAGTSITIVGLCATLAKAPIDQALTRQEADIRDINRNLVPRSEHEEKWRAIDKRFDRLIDVFDQMRRDLYVPRSNPKG